MDLSFFIANYGPGTIGSDIGLYIVRPKGMVRQFVSYYRCGAAGLKETADGDGGSNIRSRLVGYLNSWIGGGELVAVLTIPRSVFRGYSKKILLPRHQELVNKEPYAVRGDTILKYRERELHAILDQRVQRVRSGRAEWFRGAKADMVESMRAIGAGRLFVFTGDTPPEQMFGDLLTGGYVPRVVNVRPRRTPRDYARTVRIVTRATDAVRRSRRLAAYGRNARL